MLPDGLGLKPRSQGWRMYYEVIKRTVVDGPFAETKELIAGYTLIQVRSREEAMEWARRFPSSAGRGKPAIIEVRPLYETDDFPPPKPPTASVSSVNLIPRKEYEMTDVKPIPDNMHTLTPHLVCSDAAGAIDFYIRAFGAVELARLPGPNGKLMHAMVKIGDSPLMLFDEVPQMRQSRSPLSLNGTSIILHMYVKDVDATMAQAIAAGGTLTMPATDMFWGDRYGQITDPFGHQWSIATHIRDVRPEEMQAEMMKQCPP